MLSFNYLFRVARNLQGIAQAEVASKAEVTQSAVSKFEAGSSALSRENLLKIAPLLNINLEYITGKSENPFSSSGLIKMFFHETLLTGIDYSPLERIVKINSLMDVIFLVATPMIKSTIGRFTQAILMRDQDSNVFLLRRKRKGFYLAEEPELRVRFLEIAKTENKDITFQTQKISQELFLKIENGTIERGDVEDFFIQRRIRMLSLDEDRLIEEVRVSGYNVSDLLALLEEVRAGAYEVNDLLGMSKVVQAVKACGRGNI